MEVAVIDARQRGRVSAESAYAAEKIRIRRQITDSDKLKKEIEKKSGD